MANSLRKSADDNVLPLVAVAKPYQEPAVSPHVAEDIRKRLLAVQLPSPPQTLLKLLTLCQSDDTGMAELSTLVGADPAMTTKVLSVAHSAAFHRSDAQTLTLLQACSRLGTALIKVLVISESVLQTFNAFRQAISADLGPFWKHSLTVAVIARELAKRLDNASAEEAYLSGLLHDVGRLALLVAAGDASQDLFVQDDDDDLCQREEQRLDMSHTQAGAWLLEKWHLDARVIESISQHHADAVLLVDVQPLTGIVHLAHRLASVDLSDLSHVAHFAGEQGLSSDDLKAVVQTAALQVEQIARDLGLTLAPAAKPALRQVRGSSGLPNAAQTQLAEDVFDRSVLNEMALNLVNQRNLQATLAGVRQHASALLQLEDCVIFLLRSAPKMLVAASMNGNHRKDGPMSFGVDSHAPMAQCVNERQVVFSALDDSTANTLHQFMDSEEIVFIPLLTAQTCLGVLMASVPAELGEHLRSQPRKLHAFGVYAGLALARRHQADKLRRAQMAVAKQEGRLELLRISREVKQLIDQVANAYAFTTIDLCSCVRDMVQLLQDSQLVPESVHIQSELTDRLALVHGSAEMIKQVTHILLKNAWEALPDGGEIQINVGALVQRQGLMYTALSVADNAIGTSAAAVKAQLFEPISIKMVDDQRMQGLNIVNFLVEKMNGHVKFSSDEFGTRFEVLLPCAKIA